MSTFRTKKYDGKFHISLLHKKKFLGWVLKASTASSQQILAMLEMKMQRCTEQKVAATCADSDHSLLREAWTKRTVKFQRCLPRCKFMQPVMRVWLSGSLYYSESISFLHSSREKKICLKTVYRGKRQPQRPVFYSMLSPPQKQCFFSTVALT